MPKVLEAGDNTRRKICLELCKVANRYPRRALILLQQRLFADLQQDMLQIVSDLAWASATLQSHPASRDVAAAAQRFLEVIEEADAQDMPGLLWPVARAECQRMRDADGSRPGAL